MNKNIEKFENIVNQDDLNYLVDQINKGLLFAEAFKFQERALFLCLLEQLKVDVEEFQKKLLLFRQNS